MISTSRTRQWRLRNPDAYKENNLRYYRETSEKVQQHKQEIGCSFCGYNKFGGALEWHHPNGDKEFRFTTRGYFTPKETTEREKCILLCSNCHREEHYRMRM